MKKAKRGLALLLAVVLLISALPVAALADEPEADYTDEVVYNTGYYDVTVGCDEDRYDATEESGEYYDLFEEDGSYVIELPEENPFFPYEVQFTYGGETSTAWFLDEDDTVNVGGHVFSVEVYGVAQSIAFTIGEDYVIAYPEEKTFVNDPDALAEESSLLPLAEETNLVLNLTNHLLGELKDVKLSGCTFTKGDMIPTFFDSTAIAWRKMETKSDGTDNFQITTGGASIDLTPPGSNNEFYLELIVSDGEEVNQLESTNTRYIVRVQVISTYNLITFSANQPDGEAINVFSSYYNNNRGSVSVDGEDWTEGEARLVMDFGTVFSGSRTQLDSQDYTVEVYTGYYESEEELDAAVAAGESENVTSEVWGTDAPGYLADYSQAAEERPSFTVLFYKDGELAQIEPFDAYMYPGTVTLYLTSDLYAVGEDGKRTECTTDFYQAIRDEDGNVIGSEYQMSSTEYDPYGKYYCYMTLYDPDPTVVGGTCGINNVAFACEGEYDSQSAAESDGRTDIKSELFSYADEPYTGGYLADFSSGSVTFTVVDVSGTVYHRTLATVAAEEEQEEDELPEAPTKLSEDTYFSATGANDVDGEAYDAYKMSPTDDSYYYGYNKCGYQTIFILNQDGTAVEEGTTIYPVFKQGNKVNVYYGHDTTEGYLQISGETEKTFENGEAIQYSAASEDGEHLKNYWVTYVTQVEGAKLFVNAGSNSKHRNEETDMPQRVIIFEDASDYHDVFFANIGDEELTGLTVELKDAENIELDSYWTIDGDDANSLAAFTTTEMEKEYGELANVGKIRLVPVTDENGVVAGNISGTLVISSANGGSVEIELTGRSATPQLLTTELEDQAVKYVPYSHLIRTNSMAASDAVSFAVVEGTLPDGVILKPNGEIYGVPTVIGTYTFTIAMYYEGEEVDRQEYTLEVVENTDPNVYNATDDEEGYELLIAIPDEDTGEYIVEENGVVIGEVTVGENRWTNSELTMIFKSAGPFDNFVIKLFLDGEKLEEGEDYTASEGSTVITILKSVLTKNGAGTHTLAAEFREGGNDNGTMYRTAQNYTLTTVSNTTASGSSTSTSSGSSSSSGTSGNGGSGYTGGASYSGGSGQSTTTSGGSGTTTTTGGSTATTQTNTFPFTDVLPTDWFYDDVKWAYEEGLMVGVSGTIFAPDNAISQATVLLVLSRLAGVDLEEYTDNPYSDIENDKWYTSAAVWAKQTGLLPDNTDFSGDAVISRDEMAQMLVKYLKRMGADCTVPESAKTFADGDLMSENGEEAFQILYATGIFKGVGNDRMDPTGTTTRAQFSALINRIDSYLGL